ncbi:predicted protein [Naegleria gruberi]|uniref:Predicted protein n=1 Tax=Naegleria gruberi TaxID=5762 RepID=D2VA80_NAEGR|nr:uncharacterized protein NAEGRDRAFT_65767 [Naegleria gruberi]EFC46383.1 predicted protein [Naegleria gruberi]|eukprot:XP_002679127.1 predicted protein [Naegleria gruberi strain NEG-M]
MVYVLSTGSNRFCESCQSSKSKTFSPITLLPNDDESSLSKVKKIACGREHTMILLQDGQLFGIGNNHNGQVFGTSKTDDSLKIIPVGTFLEKGEMIVDAFCSQINSYVITNCGNIYWSGFETKSHSFVKIEKEENEEINGFYTSASAGHFFVKIGCKIYGSGWNSCGQLGNGTRIDKYGTLSLVSFEDYNKVEKIAMGAQFTVIATEFELYGCGLNDANSYSSSNERNNEFFKPITIPFHGKKISNVTCGGLCTIVQLENNEIFGVGKHVGNYYKKLDINEPIVCKFIKLN